MQNTPRLKKEYNEKIRQELLKELNIKNIMAVPKLEKIIVNVGLGEAIKDSKILDDMLEDIAMIAGQRPVKTKSKKAISNFKIRIGQDIGLKVTLRNNKMWEFFDRLVNIVLPRTKDFRGVSDRAFDGRGNYALGLKEHNVFPEVDPNKVTRARGMQVIFTISGNSDEQSKVLLTKLGMPFKKK
ncbi:MAG: 50S ribosomal protein L5 [candidate division WS6 bacterium GW2011_GWA2_37_6]|uniref:Large ribosomal subunit protein uL5 n=1 Tax=candidate division WS6 bacterium GW2011_GWA2_37_6 TaxID=1619087 RepID=A0A0G0GY40_9BACT|nr:MAG: 50S ribosomal protein L5 [candidate division WS6 bacterium GW2011_GWA2_37_6]